MQSVPSALHDMYVPMTTSLNPSPWYSYLLQYKNGYLDSYGPIIAAVAQTWLAAHQQEIAAMLGGAPQLVTVVPSKRGYSFETQPLVRALSMVPPLKAQLAHTLTYVKDAPVQRRQYNPDAFAAGATNVGDKRVLLLEDAWITGATPISAAGALLREGAAAVLLVSLARVVNEGYLADPSDPYRQAMAVAYDPTAWPR